ncbi:MAG: 5-formyltetrahydrofolate cyclo-ligase [Polyangiaceae bacterium]
MEKPFDHHPHSHELAADVVIRRRVKAELRKRMRGLRNTFPADVCAAKSRVIVQKLTERQDVAVAKNVALFWPIESRHEVDLRELDAQLRKRGVRVFYPAIEPETKTMTFRLVDDVSILTDLTFGFAAPQKDAHEARPDEIDVIVVPALAIAPSGHRIGYGAGYYDRTIGRFLPHAVTIGVAYDFQIVAEIPVTEGDVALDFVVTETRAFAREDAAP